MPALTRRLLGWAALAAVAAAIGIGLSAAGLDSPALFASLLAGVGAALVAPGALKLPHALFNVAQAVTGVTLGAYLQTAALTAVAGSWAPVALVSAGTLALSLLAGLALARWTEADLPTATLGMVAGGASGIVGMAGELGADDRQVAFMQYLRVLLVVALMPVIVALAFPGGGAGGGGPAQEALLGTPCGWLLTALLAPLGVVLARASRIPAGTLLGPMALSGAVNLALPGAAFAVPELLRELAFALLGLQVGLRFTRDTLRSLGRLLVPVVASVLGLIAACFGLALLLVPTTSASLETAYLATTPGGLYAVLAAAVGAHADTTFIVATQTLRLLVMVLLAPVVVRWAVRRAGRRRFASGRAGR